MNLLDLIDACPDCDDRNPTFPAVVLETARGASCVYRCSRDHVWMTSWAAPLGRAS